jgi:hypothetical protein
LYNEVFSFLDNIATILSVTLSRSISNLYEGHFRFFITILDQAVWVDLFVVQDKSGMHSFP